MLIIIIIFTSSLTRIRPSALLLLVGGHINPLELILIEHAISTKIHISQAHAVKSAYGATTIINLYIVFYSIRGANIRMRTKRARK